MFSILYRKAYKIIAAFFVIDAAAAAMSRLYEAVINRYFMCRTAVAIGKKNTVTECQ